MCDARVCVDENCIQTYTQMFIQGLFITSITAKTWKQSRCPLAGERIHKLWYIQTTEYYFFFFFRQRNIILFFFFFRQRNIIMSLEDMDEL